MNAAALPTSRSLLVPFACVVALGVLAFVAGGADLVDLTSAVSNYPWGVLVIYLSMEVVTALVADTGVMEAAAVRIARASRGRNVALLVLFGGGLFLVSGVLNNLTAVLIALPVIIAVLRAVGPSPAYLASTFALLLAMSNVGGAATPIGRATPVTTCPLAKLEHCGALVASRMREGSSNPTAQTVTAPGQRCVLRR